jgi:hypothetical protein
MSRGDSKQAIETKRNAHALAELSEKNVERIMGLMGLVRITS